MEGGGAGGGDVAFAALQGLFDGVGGPYQQKKANLEASIQNIKADKKRAQAELRSERRKHERKTRKINALSDADLVEFMSMMAARAAAKARAKAKATGISCMNNLRQMSFSWTMYADDHDGRLVPNAVFPTRNRSWVKGWLNYAQSVPDNTNTVYLMQSHFWPYHRSLGVWKCPADKSTSRHGGKQLPRVRSISMNGFLNPPSLRQWQAGYRPIRKLSDAAGKPLSELYVVLDQREAVSYTHLTLPTSDLV